MKGLSIGFYLIPGLMFGVELQKTPDEGKPILVVDLFILRLMFEVDSDDDA